MGLSGVPVAAETIALHTIFELVRSTSACVHLCRLPSAAGVALVRQATAEGLPLPSHVTLVLCGAAPYDRFFAPLAQGCVGHPLRRAHHLEEILEGRNRLFPRQVIDLVQEALRLRDDYRQGKRHQDDLRDAYEAVSYTHLSCRRAI